MAISRAKPALARLCCRRHVPFLDEGDDEKPGNQNGLPDEQSDTVLRTAIPDDNEIKRFRQNAANSGGSACRYSRYARYSAERLHNLRKENGNLAGRAACIAGGSQMLGFISRW
jgi:hypothetical protein